MKKITSLLLLAIFGFVVVLQAQKSNKISRVLEYKPAPGQHINRLFPTPAMSDTYANALAYVTNNLVGNKAMVGLGAFGGYVIVGFDHSIVNIRGEYDFKALGNAFTNSAEPGIVMVCQDLNKNGVPDPEEPWYELAGSDYHKPTTIKNYEITYYRPSPDGQKSNIRWTDNQGGEGEIKHISFATQNTMYPLWVNENSITFKGTKLAGNTSNTSTNPNTEYWILPALDWGYVDNHANNSSIDKTGFKIDWAVDDSGNPVHLDYIDFIKVHTGMLQEAGWLGETSTEFAGIEILHPTATLAVYPPVGNDIVTLDLQNTTTLAGNPLSPESSWEETYTSNNRIESQVFSFSHSSGWGGTYWDGFTMSNITDNSNHGPDSQNWVANQFGAMPRGGVNGVGSNFLVAYWGSWMEAGATSVTGTSAHVSFNDNKTYKAVGTYVSNAPWPYYGILEGDGFARAFVQGDYFKLIATGYARDGVTVTATAEHYLADFRSTNPTQWKNNNKWEWMDLSALGEVAYIRFSMESTDSGDYGINTATYFCLDKLTVEKVEDTSTGKPNTQTSFGAYRSGTTIYNLPLGAQVNIYRLNGTLYKQSIATERNIQLESDEMFIIRVDFKGEVQYLR